MFTYVYHRSQRAQDFKKPSFSYVSDQPLSRFREQIGKIEHVEITDLPAPNCAKSKSENTQHQDTMIQCLRISDI